ncbi:MAG: proteasome subunit alpha, partial [Desertimonas sp.]
GDQMFHILYDGTVFDHRDHAVLGGDAEAIGARLAAEFSDGLSLAAAVQAGARALGGDERTIPPGDLEVAVLARGNGRRCFERYDDTRVTELLGAS